MLIDSNIIIYASKPGYEFLHPLIGQPDLAVSVISSLVTRNTQDFDWIPGLTLLDPFPKPPSK